MNFEFLQILIQSRSLQGRPPKTRDGFPREKLTDKLRPEHDSLGKEMVCTPGLFRGQSLQEKFSMHETHMD